MQVSEPLTNLESHRTTRNSSDALDTGRTAGAAERGKWATGRLCPWSAEEDV